MPSNIITVQVGQCGNQIGVEFWKTMCEEHGISSTGTPISEDKPGEDQKEMFFYEAGMGNRYIPRSVLIDLEPRVINQILSSEHGQLHNMENVFQSPSGGGAGNNWASGYNQSPELIESIFDILDREAENADFLEGFALCHSISGGTGSGLGSKIIEQIKEKFPKTILQTYSVFSNLESASDVVVGPYNSILTLEWIVEHPDFIVVLDNQALYKVAVETMRVNAPSFEHINSMVSRIMTSITSPMRFYSPIYTRLSHIAAYLNPLPPMQFIQTAFSPFSPADHQFVINTSPSKILSRILEPRSLISSANSIYGKTGSTNRGSTPPSKIEHCMLSGLAILRTDENENISELNLAGIRRKTNKNNIVYPPWSSSTLNITTTKLSPYMEHRHHTSGLLLANHTNINKVLRQVAQQYDQLRRRGAFLDRFEREGVDTVKRMDESREKIQSLIDLYDEATTMGFMEDVKTPFADNEIVPSNLSSVLHSSNVVVNRGDPDSDC